MLVPACNNAALNLPPVSWLLCTVALQMNLKGASACCLISSGVADASKASLLENQHTCVAAFVMSGAPDVVLIHPQDHTVNDLLMLLA